MQNNEIYTHKNNSYQFTYMTKIVKKENKKINFGGNIGKRKYSA